MEVVPLLALLVTALGGGVGIKTLIDGLLKIRSGMSAKESQRKVDIVQQRDAAIVREQRAWQQVDREAAKRRGALEYASSLKRQLIEAGIDPHPEPVFEPTVTRAELRQMQDE